MGAVVNKFLQRIIHKAVLAHTAQAGKRGRCDAHPKVRAKPRAVGAHMSRVLLAFV